MNQRPLWAPWRIEYIRGSREEECFICRVLESPPEKSREDLVLFRGEHAMIMLNRFPYNSGHLLVAPRRHVAGYEELDAAEHAEISSLSARAIRILRDVMYPDGFNVGFNLGAAGGAGLESHIHQHIVPRWTGDTNFMPVLGDTRVVPEALESTYDVLKPRFG
ncbi:HIT family protein [Kiritimatiella glycovorans]|uniref:AP-4-A phosphorylase n=1 Tax=Kiritimatiella glycovorans TaxID=1307763 RepID=A0A0G3EDF2_9BACT|nr:HIT domain-containing protein [Kiritimatiella glycovorans]AKJ64313.1 AP-4-A phosphorylase [Kiritimatiella glycovorans]